MKHKVIVTTIGGREIETSPMETSSVAGLIALLENPHAQNALVPLESDTEPGPQRRRRHHQVHIRVHQVESVRAVPALWVGVRSLFLEAGTVWEITPDALGSGIPMESVLVRAEAVDEDHVLLEVLAPTGVRHGLKAAGLHLDAFVEVTAPVSAERLTDYGVTLGQDDTLGRYPTDDEMKARLS